MDGQIEGQQVAVGHDATIGTRIERQYNITIGEMHITVPTGANLDTNIDITQVIANSIASISEVWQRPAVFPAGDATPTILPHFPSAADVAAPKPGESGNDLLPTEDITRLVDGDGNLSAEDLERGLVEKQIGQYQLTEIIGRGGYATVYLGKHIHMLSTAAVKIFARHPNRQEQCFSEARIMASLHHKNIIQVWDCGLAGMVPFLVMDYAPHGTLRDLYRKSHLTPFSAILPYLQQIAEVVQYIHEEHLLHLDLKPDNFLLGARGEVLLTDFGTSIQAGSEEGKKRGGTVAYMAPEQIRGNPRPASDQYALAVMTYEWLAGRRPFNGSTREVIKDQLFATPEPLENYGVDRSVASLVQRALAKDPRDRFASITDFVSALAAC